LATALDSPFVFWYHTGMNFLQEFVDRAPGKDKAGIQDVLFKLVRKYNEPHRRYHDLGHIFNGLEIHEELCTKSLTAVEFFAWAYHDAEYDPKAQNNEERSAALLLRDSQTLGVTYNQAEEAMAEIMLTTYTTGAGSVITDMDLASLGSTWEVFERNGNNIWLEYKPFVPEEAFRKGRAAILNRFLERDPLYFTTEFAAAFTAQAKENLTRTIDSLMLK